MAITDNVEAAAQRAESALAERTAAALEAVRLASERVAQAYQAAQIVAARRERVQAERAPSGQEPRAGEYFTAARRADMARLRWALTNKHITEAVSAILTEVKP